MSTSAQFMLLGDFSTASKQEEGVKLRGGWECLCYQWENSQPLLWLMNEFSEWMRDWGNCAQSYPALDGTFRQTYAYAYASSQAPSACSTLWNFVEHCMKVKLIRKTHNIYEIKLPKVNTDLNVCASLHVCAPSLVHLFMLSSVHDLLLAYVHLCIVSCKPAILLRPLRRLPPAWPVPKTNRQISSLWFSLVVIVLPPWLPNWPLPPLI